MTNMKKHKKISEYQDEEALELLADIIDPVYHIISDPQIREAFAGDAGDDGDDGDDGDNKVIKVTKAIIKLHKTEIIKILARLDDVEVDKYHCNIFTLPIKVMEILNDEDLLDFFTSSLQGEDIKSSIEAMGLTQGIEKT